jgi:hypothetical protein
MEWIKCTNRLPLLEEAEYLVSDCQYVDVYWWKYCNIKKCWDWSDRDEFFDFNVTHWMPLPPIPKE